MKRSMDEIEQRRLFEGAVKHGTLDIAFWEVATRDASVGQTHEAYVKEAFRLAMEVKHTDLTARIAELEAALGRIADGDSDIYVLARTVIEGRQGKSYRSAAEVVVMVQAVAKAALGDHNRPPDTPDSTRASGIS